VGVTVGVERSGVTRFDVLHGELDLVYSLQRSYRDPAGLDRRDVVQALHHSRRVRAADGGLRDACCGLARSDDQARGGVLASLGGGGRGMKPAKAGPDDRTSGGRSSLTTRSETQIRPQGRSTRVISAKARLLRGERLMTPFEITTSTVSSGSGMASISPSRRSHHGSTPAAFAAPWARSHISGSASRPIARPVGPTR